MTIRSKCAVPARAALVLAAILLGPGVSSMAADTPVTVQLQLFHKIWRLDRKLANRHNVVVAVLYQVTYSVSTDARAAVAAWSGTSQVHCVYVALDQGDVEAALQTVVADVFYVTPMRGADIAQIVRIARARQIHTMAGLTEYLPIGLSVGIGVRNDRPKIMINLRAAKAEGAAYQAQLLQLSDIVGARE
jgi:YfiR/HmsC-like